MVIKFWFLNQNLASFQGQATALTASLILWEIWRWRNASRHDKFLDKHSIISEVLRMSNGCLSRDMGSCRSGALPHLPPGRWLKWQYNGDGFCLNIAGCFISKVGAAVGGLLRGKDGRPVIWFASKIASDNLLSSHIQAILKGLELCKDNSIEVDMLQVDSREVYDMIVGAERPPWRDWYKIKRCRSLSGSSQILQISKKANSTAIALANFGLSLSSPYQGSGPMPASASVFSREDRLGVPRFSPQIN